MKEFSRFPWRWRRGAAGVERGNRREYRVLVDSKPAAARERHKRGHQPCVPSQRWFCVAVVPTHVSELVEPVRPADHGPGDVVGVGVTGVPPLPSPGA